MSPDRARPRRDARESACRPAFPAASLRSCPAGRWGRGCRESTWDTRAPAGPARTGIRRLGVQQLSRQITRIDFDLKQGLCRPGHHGRQDQPCQTPNRQREYDRSDQNAMAAKSHAGTLKASEAPIIRNRWIRRSRWQSRLSVKNHLIIVGPALAVHPPPEQAMCLLPRSTLHGFS